MFFISAKLVIANYVPLKVVLAMETLDPTISLASNSVNHLDYFFPTICTNPALEIE